LTCRVVITGATGFLGRAIRAKAQNLPGLELICVSRIDSRTCFQVQDYSQTPPGDVLVHLAENSNQAEVNSWSNEYIRECSSILDSLLAPKRYSQVIYASSASVYGTSSPKAHSVHDSTFRNTNYNKLKLESEQRVLGSGQGGVFRITNLYGPGMSDSNVISKVLRQANNHKRIEVDNLSPIRDFLWVEDAAEAFLLMIQAFMLDSPKHGIYNLGTGVGTSIGSLANLVAQVSGTKLNQIHGINDMPTISSITLDPSLTIQTLGWRPSVELGEGIVRLWSQRNETS